MCVSFFGRVDSAKLHCALALQCSNSGSNCSDHISHIECIHVYFTSTLCDGRMVPLLALDTATSHRIVTIK
jgi:hypothetical protein